MNEQMTRSEAIEAIERELGNTEEAAQVVDWTRDMWESMTELYQRLPKELADQIIHAHIPLFDQEAVKAGNEEDRAGKNHDSFS